MIETFFDKRVIVTAQDITQMQCDAIVNAANCSLFGGGGVDGAIHKAGGPAILEECKQLRTDYYPKGLPTAATAVTTAGNMQAKYVIHTVGPIWSGGQNDEEDLLEKAYLNCLMEAEMRNCESIAFPAISTGIYGFPRERAAMIIKRLLTTWIPAHANPQSVYLVFFNQHDAEIFLKSPGDF